MDTTHDEDFGRFLAHSGWLTALARELVRDRALADDVVQDTWTAALRAPRAAVTSERGWLATLLANAVRSRARSESARSARERRTARDERVDGPDALVERAETQHRLLAHVLALGEPYRSVLLEHYVEGRSCAEIARRSGASESTVRTHLSRAHARLRERLERGDGRGALLALAPLLDASAPTRATSAGTSAAATAGIGAIALSTSVKLGLVAAAALVAWWCWPAGDAAAPALVGSTAVDARPADEPRREPAAELATSDRRAVEAEPMPPAPAPAAIAPAVAAPVVELPPSVIEIEFVDADRPVPDVAVWIAPSRWWPIQYCHGVRVRVPSMALHTTTPGTGIARFADLQPGTFRLGFDVDAAAERPTRFVTLDASSGRRHTIVLGSSTVRGRVVGEDGLARAGVSVAVSDAVKTGSGHYAAAHTETDDDGRYSIGSLAAGSHFVMYDADELFNGGGDTERKRVELAAGEIAVVDFGGREATTVWTGRVLNAFGEPFPGTSSVSFTDERTNASTMATCDAEGRFERRISNGAWRVNVRAAGCSNAGYDMGKVVLDGKALQRDLVIGGTRLRGRVLADTVAEKNPATDERYCLVLARHKEWGPHFDRRAYTVFPAGDYLIDGLEPGTWQIAVDEPDPDFVEITVTETDTVIVRDVMPRAR